MAELYDDAVAAITSWSAPDAQAETRRRFLDLLEAEPGAVRASHPRHHLTASAVVVSADLERVLLCLHGRVRVWLQLGGHLEPQDATLADAALREAFEESGIEGLRVHPEPIDLDVHPVNCRYGPSEHFDVRFAVLAPPGAVERVSDESLKLGWFPYGGLPQPLGESVDRMILPAFAAWRPRS